MNFNQQLSRQLGFLERSCQSFDAGFTDEGIRIATTVRVLIHDTDRSTSLLRHLRATDIRLTTTCEGASERAIMYSGMGSFKWQDGIVSHEAGLSTHKHLSPIVVKRWWEQTVYAMGGSRLSRKDLVLAAANRDGGAHVDPKLTPAYVMLGNASGNSYFHMPVTGQPGKFAPVMDAHLIYLRQVGFEILNSPKLIELST